MTSLEQFVTAITQLGYNDFDKLKVALDNGDRRRAKSVWGKLSILIFNKNKPNTRAPLYLKWKLNRNHFQDYIKQSMEGNSLIEDREKLKMNINAITSELDKALVIKYICEENLRKLEAEKGQIERTKHFTKKVQTHTKVPVPTKNMTMFCKQCTHTCHEDCKCSNNSDKASCWAMTDGYCRVCPDRCKWDWHDNHPYIYKDDIVVSEEIVKADKQLFDDATKQLSVYEQMKRSLEREKAKAQEDMNKLLGQINYQLQSLKKTAILTTH
ncbi:hypothetical protein LOD99_10572 [Oopsacas minuta]|uniref:Uncharacterized protein n=1 Tax=Oopsacas minuta TaxID=111878 RepID=A0AAV7KGV8_9METZ|nr:hypothetical protein LOD99_10572 [Oopsacas minuta]